MPRSIQRKNLWATFGILCLAASLVRPIWGAPADILDSPAPVPGDPAPRTRSLGAGDATVATQTGALEYSFPLILPPGRSQESTPALALHYSSRGPIYGGVAQGWSLPIPEISWDKSAGELGNRWVSSMTGGKPLIPVSEAAPPDTEATFRAQHDSSYARYQKLLPGEDVAWRVLTSDGMIYRFGEVSRIENNGDVGSVDVPPHFFPLTSTEDPFGNTVEYIWHVDPISGIYSGGEAGRRAIYLDRIEYSSNPAVAVEAHARIELNVNPPAFRPDSDFPIGASQEVIDPSAGLGVAGNFDHEFWYRGAHAITSIDTKVKDSSASSWRTVRRYELNTQEVVVCEVGQTCDNERDFGFYRTLRSIQEIGDPDGAALALPKVSFGYGPGTWGGTNNPIPARDPTTPKTYRIPPDGTDTVNWLASGTRWSAGSRSSEVKQMLGDLDGDGRLDLLRSDIVGGTCVLSWHRNVSGTPAATADIDFALRPGDRPVAEPDLGGRQHTDRRRVLLAHRPVLPPRCPSAVVSVSRR